MAAIDNGKGYNLIDGEIRYISTSMRPYYSQSNCRCEDMAHFTIQECRMTFVVLGYPLAQVSDEDGRKPFKNLTG